MAKEGTVTWLESQKKLSVIADAKTHELVMKTIEQVNLDLPKPKPKSVRIFDVSPAQKEKFSQVFAELVGEFGDASLISGAGTNEIAILADTEQQAAVESVINSLANLESISEKELTTIEISIDDPSQLITLLNEKLKGIEFLVNPEKTTLFAWISKSEIESVKKTVKTVEALLPKKLTSTLEVYKIAGSVEEIVTFISPVASSAKVTSDAANQRIVVWANSLDHAKIKATIDKVDVLSPDVLGGERVCLPGAQARRIQGHQGSGDLPLALGHQMPQSVQRLDVVLTPDRQAHALAHQGGIGCISRVRTAENEQVDILITLQPTGVDLAHPM